MNSNNLLGNSEVRESERRAVLEKLENFFRDVLPAQPQPRESAMRVESSIFQATTTREEYRQMIVSRIQYLQQQARHMNGSGSLQGKKNSELTLREIAEIRAQILEMKSKLPIIDQIIASQSTGVIKKSLTLQSTEPEALRKFASLRNVLVKQIGMLGDNPSEDTFILSPVNATTLVDQLNRMISMFTSPISQPALLQLSRRIQAFRSSGLMSPPMPISLGLPVKSKRFVEKELQMIVKEAPIRYFIDSTRGDSMLVKVSLFDVLVELRIDSRYPDELDYILPSGLSRLPPLVKPVSIAALLRHILLYYSNKEPRL